MRIYKTSTFNICYKSALCNFKLGKVNPLLSQNMNYLVVMCGRAYIMCKQEALKVQIPSNPYVWLANSYEKKNHKTFLRQF